MRSNDEIIVNIPKPGVGFLTKDYNATSSNVSVQNSATAAESAEIKKIRWSMISIS